MNSKQTSIRVVGQRSITSTLRLHPSVRSNGRNKDVNIKAPSEKRPTISLSKFLNKKLDKTSVLPGSVKRKDEQFLFPEGSNDDIQLGNKDEKNGEKGLGQHCSLDIMFEKLKQADKREEHGDRDRSCDETMTSCLEDMERSKKRRKVFAGDGHKQSVGKVVVVLGEDSKNKQKRNGKRRAIPEKSTTYFNHYANGGGWWDCEKEGVDNEEVGCNGTWEVYHIPH
ncbi:unnamed protein product [Cuscuta europaea]|uniref:Uncharacterized protein n=1 Tax=Cuscuta europaea TaxID=41803 RepID=A0A9P0Z3G7_CUSEU|nr:unnamed protein product [Cuscuta europaea]